MKLKKFIEEIIDTLEEEIKNAIYEDKDFIVCNVSTSDGYIDVSYKISNGDTEAVIYHDNEDTNRYERFCPRLAEFIENEVKTQIDIHELEEQLNEELYYDDIWHRNGFADEADYLRYRYA